MSSEVKYIAIRCYFVAISLILSGSVFAVETIPYGTKAGMEVTVVKKVGIGTANATIYTKHTAKNAKEFCAVSALNFSKACVDEVLATTKLKDRVTGDCVRQVWKDIHGNSFSFHGRNKNRSLGDPEFIIKHDSGEILDESSASGYFIQLATLKMLCPAALSSKKVASSRTQPIQLPFLGKWAPGSLLCNKDIETTDNGPIEITKDGIASFDLFYCGIDSIAGGPDKWTLSVTCNNEGNPYGKQVNLEVDGDRLIYQSMEVKSLGIPEREEIYFRCPAPTNKPRDNSPLAVAFRGQSEYVRKSLQARLGAQGFYHDQIDGRWGANTRKAFEYFAIQSGNRHLLTSNDGAVDLIQFVLNPDDERYNNFLE